MKPKDILNEWIRLFKAADAEGISALYHDDAVNFQVAGKEAIYEKFRNEFALVKMVFGGSARRKVRYFHQLHRIGRCNYTGGNPSIINLTVMKCITVFCGSSFGKKGRL